MLYFSLNLLDTVDFLLFPFDDYATATKYKIMSFKNT